MSASFDTPPVPMVCLAAARSAKVNVMPSRCKSIGLGIATILLATGAAAYADATCYCRTSTGEHVAVGETACLKTNSGMREARCGFVLNNTSWKFTGNACPLAGQGDKHGKTAGLAISVDR
jgi:hypothetical protein